MGEQQEGDVEGMESALEKLNQRRFWIWSMFVLCSFPGLINAYHIMVTVFFSHIPPYWCRIPELEDHGWTSQEIRNISSPNGVTGSSCIMVDWNYTQLAGLGYQAALDFVTKSSKPGVTTCKYFAYEEDVPHSSTVTEWDLVCDRLPLKSSIQSSIAIGKFVGGFIFGFISDKYGRKNSFILASVIYIISGPLAAFAPSYWMFIVFRFFLGISGSGTYQANYTILAELSSSERRSLFGCTFNMSYPIGYMTLSVIALMFPAWRALQMAISVPMLLLIVCCCILPESPRWLLTQGRRVEAWAIIRNIDKDLAPPITKDITNIQGEEGPFVPLYKRLLEKSSKLFTLFTTAELCKRICISYFTWVVAALTYYALALNADNFSSNRYVYLALAGLVEAPSYVLAPVILIWLGRKTTSALLFLVSGIALISILLISQHNQTLIVIVALLGRFADSAVFSVVILHTSELFPTSDRSTAVSTSLAMSQLGSISAPYIVDILGKKAWYIPSTLCGALALSSAALILLLPETRNRQLLDTYEDLKHTKEKVSFRNCCTFS